MKMLLSAVIALLVLLSAYYFWLGAQVVRAELHEFAETRDDTDAFSRQDLKRMLAVATPVYWHLQDGSRQRAFYRASTNGAAIIYLHGSPGRSSGFHDQIEVMAAHGFGALAIDLPGYGESEGTRRWDESFLESVRLGCSYLEDQGVSMAQIGLFGYSMGAYVAVETARHFNGGGGLLLLAGYTNLTEQLQQRFRRRIPGMGYFAIGAAKWSGVTVSSMDLLPGLRHLDDMPVLVEPFEFVYAEN